MVFSSLIFLYLFLPLTLLIYFIAPNQLRNAILIAASLVFYAWGEPVYIFLMLFSTVIDYMYGLLIDKYRYRKSTARVFLVCSIVGNLGILGFFKYYGFLVENINSLFGLHFEVSTLPLPVGISFYTFQTMSYIIDVYRDKVPVQKNLIAFGTYVTMFPQLVAGPIVAYGDVAKQLTNRQISISLFGEGTQLFIRGLAKKVLLANHIGMLWSSIKATPMSDLTVASSWIGILAFTLQIYFDFSGYSDMARGLGKMFGFELTKNFNYPYISTSVSEFWRRWHMSLGSWFREYVYIPLGGNRVGIVKQLRNLFVVWFLTGLWHGASWNFIIWGLYFGCFIVMEKLFLHKWFKQLPRGIGNIYTLLIVMVGWVFFDLDRLSAALSYVEAMFGLGTHQFADNNTYYYLSTNLVVLLLAVLTATPLPKKMISVLKNRYQLGSAILSPILYVLFLLLSTAYLVNETYNPFLYFRF
ncbi:MBOAT family O-acyltransferase [Paenibacillus apiarius]|uniref:MBOAT family protein n=1 Tax=Paenibacillus apiarius TaxID=46240 RepID=A0ABT4DXR5_9BACL|nr:MBOAT family O-acyltransferase [Paenibacillus apiarius]MCY9517612.1 MBOAT family protein [Paenibacillus apiarius]MCY9522128.1 MBOAT family protein [Paenibacillus apiarius]MCY9552583.1 MBOAT family protein [Paenibacillus apiarius]MCY9559232.1 MBOAT family protein [Paenibacillus apiarius]MCY9683655.1 MBOAT family protein [Paenibacillus apiarius]